MLPELDGSRKRDRIVMTDTAQILGSPKWQKARVLDRGFGEFAILKFGQEIWLKCQPPKLGMAHHPITKELYPGRHNLLQTHIILPNGRNLCVMQESVELLPEFSFTDNPEKGLDS